MASVVAELSARVRDELREAIGIDDWRRYEEDWYDHLSLLDHGEAEGRAFHILHSDRSRHGSQPKLVRQLILKTRALPATPRSAHWILDQALSIASDDDAVPMVRKAREVFHDHAVCVADGWLFRPSADPNTSILGAEVVLHGVPGIVWAYHPRFQVWKVQFKPLIALNYRLNFNDIDREDFEACGIVRVGDLLAVRPPDPATPGPGKVGAFALMGGGFGGMDAVTANAALLDDGMNTPDEDVTAWARRPPPSALAGPGSGGANHSALTGARPATADDGLALEAADQDAALGVDGFDPESLKQARLPSSDGLVYAGKEMLWPARVLSVDEIVHYRSLAHLPANFPKRRSEVAVVLLYPHRTDQDFEIEIFHEKALFPIANPPKTRHLNESKTLRSRYNQGFAVARVLYRYAHTHRLPPPNLEAHLTNPTSRPALRLAALNALHLNASRYPDHVLDAPWTQVLEAETNGEVMNLAPPGSKLAPQPPPPPPPPAPMLLPPSLTASALDDDTSLSEGSATGPHARPDDDLPKASKRPASKHGEDPAHHPKKRAKGAGSPSTSNSTASTASGGTVSRSASSSSGSGGGGGGGRPSAASAALSAHSSHMDSEAAMDQPNSQTPPAVAHPPLRARHTAADTAAADREVEHWRQMWLTVLRGETATKKHAREVWNLFSEHKCDQATLRGALDNVAGAARHIDSVRTSVGRAILEKVRRRDFQQALRITKVVGLGAAREQLNQISLAAIDNGDTALVMDIAALIEQAG